jgi:RNA polymerase sigma factor (sigma-70 family)
MIPGGNGFINTDRACCFARACGPVRRPTPRMWCRRLSCGSGATSANWPASRRHWLSPPSAGPQWTSAAARIVAPVREQQAEEMSGNMAPLFETAVEDRERILVVEAALRRLPSEQREVLVLKIWGELTFEQIAGQLAISPNTAASRYRYGLAALRKDLTPLCHG